MPEGVKVVTFLQDNTKNKPNEDSLLASKGRGLFSVADGVTRFVPEGKEYPSPSPASAVSDIFCLHTATLNTTARSEDVIREAFRGVNELIGRLNEAKGITKETTDYLENDFYSCVGVLGMLAGNTLRYGYIGDCGLLVFDKDFNPVFLSSNNELGPLEMFREGMAFTGAKERMIFVRKNLRNRPHSRIMTYGALTGEEEALAYVRTGSISLELHDTVILFSDGILPFIFDVQFRAALRNQLYSGDDSVELVRKTIDILTGKLYARHVSNLDDDKAFIAFQLV